MLTLVCCRAARDAIDCQSYFTKVGKTKLMPIPLEVPLLPLPPPLLPLTTTNTSPPPSTPCVPCQNVNKHTQTATGTATGSCTCRRTAPTHHKTQARAAISRRFPRQVASGKLGTLRFSQRCQFVRVAVAVNMFSRAQCEVNSKLT